jgi:hypothetical protein
MNDNSSADWRPDPVADPAEEEAARRAADADDAQQQYRG